MTTAAFIDGNWLLHRNYLTLGKSSNVPERALPLRMLDSCSRFVLRLNVSHAVLAFDGPNNFRYGVFPQYKANRSGVTHSGEEHAEVDISTTMDKDELYRHLPTTMDLFQAVGFPCVQKERFEADDLVSAGSHAFAMRSPERHSWIVCRDKDSFQDIRSRVRVFWPEQGKDPERIVDAAAVERRFGLTPVQFGDYQVLTGDAIDNVPSVVGGREAKKILKQHGSLREFMKTEEGKTFFYKYEQELRRNMKLIRMDKRCWCPEDHEISLSRVRESQHAFRTYGKLPDSFNQVRAMNRPRQTLF